MTWIERRTRSGKLARAGWWCCLSLYAWLQAGVAFAQHAERRAERPAGQAHSSVAYMERTFLFPVSGACELDFFVDSEAGQDFLRVRLDGTVRFAESGRRRAGRARVDVPAGSHVLRVAYEKNASGTAGRDTAWVDNLRCAGGSLNASFRFDDPLLQAPVGWQVGGANGGWDIARHDAKRSLRRPAAGAFTGYLPGGVRTASEHNIVWPSVGAGQRNLLVLTYFVDSEEGHDYFKVFVDGSEKLAASGPQQSKKVSIDVGAAGTHLVRFEYVKDESVDDGLDDARVLQFEARVDGDAFQVSGFETQSVGVGAEDWTASTGAAAGWVIAPGFEPRLYVAPLSLSSEPVADGSREGAYDQSTKVRFLQGGSKTEPSPGQARVLLSSGTQALSLLLSAPARTSAAGGEAGELTVFLDGEHLQTLRGQGCGRAGATPSSEDRRIRVSYDGLAGGAPTVTTAQDVGSCDPLAPWQAATTGQQLLVTAAVAETSEAPGFVHLELRVVLPVAGLLEQGAFGLAVEAVTKPSIVYQLPSFDAHRIASDDVSSWESVRLGSTSPGVTLPRYAVVDATPKQFAP